MDETTRLTIQVLVSAAIIFGVLWWMWRMPGEPVLDSALAPLLALVSVWVGLASVLFGGSLWFIANPDLWIVIHVVVWAAAVSMATLTLWIYRHTPPEQMSEQIQLQRTQARVGLILGLVGVMLWYLFIVLNKPPLTLIGS